MNQNMKIPNYNKSDARRKLIMSILGMFIILFMVIGLSFAAYKNTIITGESAIATGSVSVSFTESNSYINIKNGMPVSDEVGKNMNDNSFSFAVTTSAEDSVSVPYAINITTDENNTLDDSFVKVYLLKENEEVLHPSFVSDLSVYSNRANSRELYFTSDRFLGEVKEKTTHYTLKVWIDKDFEVSSDNNKSYKLKVNVDSLLSK